jgi:hypothetical protein
MNVNWLVMTLLRSAVDSKLYTLCLVHPAPHPDAQIPFLSWELPQTVPRSGVSFTNIHTPGRKNIGNEIDGIKNIDDKTVFLTQLAFISV